MLGCFMNVAPHLIRTLPLPPGSFRSSISSNCHLPATTKPMLSAQSLPPARAARFELSTLNFQRLTVPPSTADCSAHSFVLPKISPLFATPTENTPGVPPLRLKQPTPSRAPSITPVESILTEKALAKSFKMNTCEKHREGRPLPSLAPAGRTANSKQKTENRKQETGMDQGARTWSRVKTYDLKLTTYD